ncbi:hypothetical protein BGZ65_012033 [Modicella reniformis]|uniref:Uncharacterized protein n=1 Tax=Modicella reniformis TaxID=1440133 RepID=A0A9P6MKD3_9FUNG|nr:hypothetical protein BGZ65_012033 [Modicella reniformis]
MPLTWPKIEPEEHIPDLEEHSHDNPDPDPDPEYIPTKAICTVDDTGVFSVSHVNTQDIIRGLQYIPSAASGSWIKITGLDGYRSDPLSDIKLSNAKDDQGKNILMSFAYGRPRAALVIGALDPTTMTMIQGPSTDFTGYHEIDVAVNVKSIFIFGTSESNARDNFLNEYPASVTSVTTLGVGKSHDISAISPCDVYMEAVGDSVLILCANTIGRAFVLRETVSPLPPIPDGPLKLDLRFKAGIDSFPVPFFYYRDHHGTFSLPINGPLMGVPIPAKNNITIQEGYGDVLPQRYPEQYMSSWGSELGRSRGIGCIGAIAGGINAVVIVIIAVLGFDLRGNWREVHTTVAVTAIRSTCLFNSSSTGTLSSKAIEILNSSELIAGSHRSLELCDTNFIDHRQNPNPELISKDFK